MPSQRKGWNRYIVGGLLIAFGLLARDSRAQPPGDADVPPPPPLEAYNVHTLMKYATDNVATFLGADKKKEKAVGLEVRVPPAMKGAGSNAFVQLLSEQLAARKIRVASTAEFTLLVDCKLGEGLAVNISMKMIDRGGKEVLDGIMSGTLDNEVELLRYFGLTGGGKDFGSDAIKKPRVFLKGTTQARASRDGQLGVEVLVNKAIRQLKPEDGYCFAALDLGQEYEIKLVNDSDEEVLAQVLVDGLSVFHFSELRATDEARKGRPKYRFYVVPPGGTVTVQGWHKRVAKDGKTNVQSFKITPPEESAAGKLGKADAVGVISVEFHSCKLARPKDKLDPVQLDGKVAIPVVVETKDRKEKPHRLVALRGAAQLTPGMGTRVGTGFGTEKLVDLKEVARWIGPVREVVSIRYKRPE